MKRLRNIIVWMLIAVVSESAIFLYVDKDYLAADTKFKPVNIDLKSKSKNESLKLALPSDYKTSIKLSTDGKYIAFKNGNNLKVVNTTTGESTEVVPAANEIIDCFTWVYGNDRILLTKKNTKLGKFHLYHYDPRNKDSLTEERNYLSADDTTGEEEAIYSKSSKSAVTDIFNSPLSGGTYIRVKANGAGGRDQIYLMDRMNQLEPVSSTNLKTASIGRSLATYNSAKFVYEDTIKGKIYSTDYKGVIPTGTQKARLLGVDYDTDDVYIGIIYQGNKDQVETIYSGDIGKSFDTWNKISLSKPAYVDNIIVDNGTIYVNDAMEGKITDVVKNKQMSYDGNFIGVFKSGIVSYTSDNMLKKQLFKNMK
ncbi:hypothetical protein IAI10_20950 [Clostridium sp. 19966]|uniref:hypothetical protein n=1 Tax=Clostridium sp. 19966 TaxID=2768166 RepID=UPI0028E073C1|nr:hypothetical protein [Clostridium sp. 19966]MDT8719122.1 hypothetical protein [Clostridium sp. 19966]